MRQTADCEPETVAERPVQNAQADGFVGSRNVSPIVFLAPADRLSMDRGQGLGPTTPSGPGSLSVERLSANPQC